MTDKNAEQAALDAALAFIDTFNARDHVRQSETLNYPHIRLANGEFRTISSAEEFISQGQRGEVHLEREGWHHTVVKNIEAIHSSADKVHISITNDRCRADGTVYKRFETLWIATLLDGKWGIQFRSSYLT